MRISDWSSDVCSSDLLFRQDRARVWGFEFEGAAPLAQIGGFHIGADVTADMTRAKIDNGPYIPRIPPLRILGGIEANGERLDVRAEVEWRSEERRVGNECGSTCRSRWSPNP